MFIEYVEVSVEVYVSTTRGAQWKMDHIIQMENAWDKTCFS